MRKENKFLQFKSPINCNQVAGQIIVKDAPNKETEKGCNISEFRVHKALPAPNQI